MLLQKSLVYTQLVMRLAKTFNKRTDIQFYVLAQNLENKQK